MSKIVLTTVASDAHTWNLVYFEALLREQGHVVRNLGPCVPDEAVVAAVRESQPDLLVVSTVNGHGAIDGARVIRAVRATPGGADLAAIIGGRLGIRGHGDDAVAALLEAGYDDVYTESRTQSPAAYLHAVDDLLRKAAARPRHRPVGAMA